MSEFAPDLPPSQQFRSPLGTPQGVPGPLAAPAAEPPPDLGAPPPGAMSPDAGRGLQAILGPPPGPGEEVDVLKSLIVHAKDYLDLPTVDESEKVEMLKAMAIFQKLLAQNQQMADQATGSSATNRKLLGG